LGWHGNYTNNNFNYPYFEKEDMVLWGHLECGEGCYTYESFAISESDEKINIKYIERVPGEINYKQSGGYVKDAYGLTLRNQRIYMKYDSTQKTFYEDPNKRISFSGYVGSVDILPGGDIIATDFNTLNLYSLKTDSSLVSRI